MTRWEYAQGVRLQFWKKNRDTWDRIERSTWSGASQPGDTVGGAGAWSLSQAGLDGWELISVETERIQYRGEEFSSNHPYSDWWQRTYVFKRPLED